MRVCSDIDDFDYNVIQLASHFLRRKYPLELLQNAKWNIIPTRLSHCASTSMLSTVVPLGKEPVDKSIKSLCKLAATVVNRSGNQKTETRSQMNIEC